MKYDHIRFGIFDIQQSILNVIRETTPKFKSLLSGQRLIGVECYYTDNSR
jgi:hypothetical protein